MLIAIQKSAMIDSGDRCFRSYSNCVCLKLCMEKIDRFISKCKQFSYQAQMLVNRYINEVNTKKERERGESSCYMQS